MITPKKYLNLDYSVVNIVSKVLEKLISEKRITYYELKKYIKIEIGEKALENFPYAISFLFLLEKIEYISELDLIELHEVEQDILK